LPWAAWRPLDAFGASARVLLCSYIARVTLEEGAISDDYVRSERRLGPNLRRRVTASIGGEGPSLALDGLLRRPLIQPARAGSLGGVSIFKFQLWAPRVIATISRQ
jgi:hypothetical protein